MQLTKSKLRLRMLVQKYQFWQKVAFKSQENEPFFVDFPFMNITYVQFLLINDLIYEFLAALAFVQLVDLPLKPFQICLNYQIITPLNGHAVLWLVWVDVIQILKALKISLEKHGFEIILKQFLKAK